MEKTEIEMIRRLKLHPPDKPVGELGRCHINSSGRCDHPHKICLGLPLGHSPQGPPPKLDTEASLCQPPVFVVCAGASR